MYFTYATGQGLSCELSLVRSGPPDSLLPQPLQRQRPQHPQRPRLPKQQLGLFCGT